MRRGLATLSLLGALALSAGAHADDKEACIAASDGADRLDDARKLIELRERLRFCSREACPKAVRDECEHRLEALQSRIPTIVVRATDPQGADVVDAKVYVDGVQVAATIDGKAIELDPGPHTIRVRSFDGGREQKVVAAEGDHLRPITLPLEVYGDAPPPTTAKEPDVKYTPGHPVQRWIGLGLIVVGVGATIGSVAFAVSALGLRDQFNMEGTGIPNCNSPADGPPYGRLADGSNNCHAVDRDGNTKAQSANTQFVFAGVLGFTALVTGVVGTVLFSTSFPHAITRARLTPVLAPGYAGLALGGTF
jgi:hypothetical protein